MDEDILNEVRDPREPRGLNLFICTGEVSADKYASNILDELYELTAESNLRFNIWGMGGKYLAKHEDVEIIQDSSKLGIIGLVDIIKNLYFFYQLEKRIKEELLKRKPNVALFIDYPGLNLRLAEFIKKEMPYCKVIYFIAPQVWAWNKKRIHKLPKLIDRLLTILPFEEELHKQHGTSAQYVGNPSMFTASQLDEVDPVKVREHYQLSQDKKLIGIFPGSRKREIQLMLPVLLQSAKLLAEQADNVQFVLVRASSIAQETIDKYFEKYNISQELIKVVEPDSNYIMQKTIDIAWLTSGTVTLECACMGVPLILGYKEIAIGWKLYEKIRHIEYIGLPNIIAGKLIYPELLQENNIPENWVNKTKQWLEDEELYSKQKELIKEHVINKLQEGKNPFEEVAKELIYANKMSHLESYNKMYMAERAQENSMETSKRQQTRSKFYE